MKTIEVKLFGAFRKYIPQGTVNIDIDKPCTVTEFKNIFFQQIIKINPDFVDIDLVCESALANEQQILEENANIEGNLKLAFLPPVCGG